MKKLRFILNFIGTKNWYHGIDKPNLWQWLYKWRISLKTVLELYNIFYPKSN